MRWFPDRKGMISGVAVAGFGFGALLWIKLAGNWGDLLDSTSIGWTFVIYGGIFAVLVVFGSTMMKMPPAGWLPAGYTPPEKTAAGGAGFSPKEMLRTPQFYLIFLTFVASAGVGLMATGVMKLAPVDELIGSRSHESTGPRRSPRRPPRCSSPWPTASAAWSGERSATAWGASRRS